MSMQPGFLRHLAPTLALGLAFTLAPQAAEAIDPSYSGSWYTPAESGSGYNLEIFTDDRALLFWYTYNDDGDPLWFYSEGVIDGETIDFDVYYSDGMTFSAPVSANRDQVRWGSLMMEFSDCNTATISYDGAIEDKPNAPEGTREVPVQRLVNIASLPCRQPASGYWAGRHYDPTTGGLEGAWAVLDGVLTEDGRLYFASIEDGYVHEEESDEVFIGTYEIQGDTAVFQYQVCDVSAAGDGGCVPAQGTAEFAFRDFIRGTGTTTQWGTQPFELTYRTVYDRAVSLSSLAGEYTYSATGVDYEVSIDGTGALAGSSTNGCQFDGQLSTIDGNFNAFSYEGTMSGCASQAWEGVAVNLDDVPGDRARLRFIVDTGDGAVVFDLKR